MDERMKVKAREGKVRDFNDLERQQINKMVSLRNLIDVPFGMAHMKELLSLWLSSVTREIDAKDL